MKVILHVDMDSFFSAVEVRERPMLKGLPVVVGMGIEEDKEKKRGVVSTCSYEARKYGIHSGMAISEAYKLCSDANFLPVNRALYEKVSEEIMSFLRKYADKFEQMSIDEAFLDVSTKIRSWQEAKEYAMMIKREIKKKEGLSCSVGVAPNKTIAKMASDFVKPDGLTVVEEEKLTDFLSNLDVKKIPGVGAKTERVLKGLKIEKIGQLASYDVQKLVEKFGKRGYKLHMIAKGIDESEVEERGERKSLSREMTLEEDTRDNNTLIETINELAKDVYEALKEESLIFRTISVKVKLEDFSICTKAKTLKNFCSDLSTINNITKKLMRCFNEDKRIRLLGIKLSNLKKIDKKQKTF